MPQVEEAPLHGGDELLRRAEVVGVVGLVEPAERHQGAVVEVVVPEGVHSVSALLQGADDPDVLGFVLRYQKRPAPEGGLSRPPGDGRQDVLMRGLEYLLGGIEPVPVHVELLHPVRCVGEEELPHRPGVGAVEVGGIPPLVLVPVAEVMDPQPNSPGNSATGITSSTVTPSSASSGSSRAATFQVPSGVKVPTCISYSTCPFTRPACHDRSVHRNAPGSTTCEGPWGPSGWKREEGSG